MNVSNMHRKLKQILNDGNAALVNKGLGKADSLCQIPQKLNGVSINRLSCAIDRSIMEVFTFDLNGVASIGSYAFSGCKNLTSVTIPNSVTSIGDDAFKGCSKLTDITIPNSVTEIGIRAFESCTKLTSITIPNSVTSIYAYAFYSCTSLTDMYLYPTKPPSLNISFTISHATTSIHVPIGCGEAYRAATNWSTFADIIVEDIITS